MVRERQNEIDLHIDAPNTTYAEQHIQNLILNITSGPQGLHTTISGEREGEKGPHLLINAQGLIADNTISQTSLSVSQTLFRTWRRSSVASFSRRNGDLVTHLHLNPSTINFDR